MKTKVLSERDEAKLKRKVQLVMLAGGVVLLAAKFVAFFITNSVMILTDAVESIVNVSAAAITLVALVLAGMPKDRNHPYGHGKIEMISASLEGLMILFAGGFIIFEGIYRLFIPHEIEKLDVGIIIVAIAGIVNFVMGSYSIRIGKRHDSIALISGGKHLHSDAYSTLGMIVGLVILRISGEVWIDSLVAIIFGFIILLTGFGILRKTFASLTDEADPEVLDEILEIISKNRSAEWIDVHNLKVTKYGSNYYIDCDLTLPLFFTIEQGHSAYSRFKTVLKDKFSKKVFFCVHFDSCEMKYCRHCQIQNCPSRKTEFEKPVPFTLKRLTSDLRHSD